MKPCICICMLEMSDREYFVVVDKYNGHRKISDCMDTFMLCTDIGIVIFVIINYIMNVYHTNTD